MTLLVQSLFFPLQIANMLMKRKKTFCKAESVIKSYMKIVFSLLHGGKHAVDKVEQIALSNKTLDALWLLSHQPYIHKRVNGNAEIDGRGERNQKRLKSTALDHGKVHSVTIVKLPAQNFSQVVPFKLLLRDISLRTFFWTMYVLICERVYIFPQHICECRPVATGGHSGAMSPEFFFAQKFFY